MRLGAITPAQRNRMLPWLLVFGFLTISVLSMRHMTITVDEPGHLTYGMRILNLRADRFDDSKMPITTLNALPAKLASLLPPGWIQRNLVHLPAARLVTVLASTLLGLLCYRWGAQLYGPAAGLASIFMFYLEPSIIAHSQLVTTDIYAAAGFTLVMYSAWRYSQSPGTARAVGLGLALGLCQVTKYTGVALYGLVPITLIIARSRWGIQTYRERGPKSLMRSMARASLHAFVVLICSILVIHFAFLFRKTLTPLQDYSFRSGFFTWVQASLSGAGGLRVPLPFPYLQGLDWVMFRERTGAGFGPPYMLGQLSEHGFPGYFFVAFVFKVPLAIQAALLLSVVTILRRKDWGGLLEKESFLLVPILFCWIYFNFYYRAQIGLRYLLVVFPVMLILAGKVVDRWREYTRLGKGLALLLGAYLLVSVLSYFPHYIPYFNELVVDRRLSYRILADSDLDWGQARWYLERYMEAHPESVYEPAKPVAGTIIVSANDLTGIMVDPSTFAWLRENFEPTGTIAYSYLVYTLSEEDIALVCEKLGCGTSSGPAMGSG